MDPSHGLVPVSSQGWVKLLAISYLEIPMPSFTWNPLKGWKTPFLAVRSLPVVVVRVAGGLLVWILVALTLMEE